MNKHSDDKNHPWVNKEENLLIIRTMGDIEKQTENSVKDLREQLQSMPVDMRIFSLCMRAPYSTQAVAPVPKALESLGNSETKPETTQWCTLKVSSIRTKS